MTDRDTQRPTRVAINGLHARSGGGVTYLRNILRHTAAADDLEFHLFLHEDQCELFAPIPEHVRLHTSGSRRGFLAMHAWEQAVMPFVLRRAGVEVTFSPANFGPLLAPRPVVLLRNALAVVNGERRLARRLYWLGLAAMTWLSLLTCRRAIAVSRYALDQLTAGTGPLLRGRSAVIPHGIDPAFRPQRRPGSSKRFLLVVSDIYVQKNLHGLVEALPAVRARIPDIRLKVAGRPIDRGYFENVRARAGALGVAGCIEFLGHCPTGTLIDLYARCAVLVFPSTVETFGNALVEAMASGVPIACSNTSAMPEVAGDAAVYFDPREPEQIAARLIELLEDGSLAERLSETGLRRSRRYSWEVTANRTWDVLRAAAGSHTAGSHAPAAQCAGEADRGG